MCVSIPIRERFCHTVGCQLTKAYNRLKRRDSASVECLATVEQQCPVSCVVSSSPLRLRDCHEKGGGKIVRTRLGKTGAKQCLLDMAEPLHPWAHRSCGCLYKTCTWSCQPVSEHRAWVVSQSQPVSQHRAHVVSQSQLLFQRRARVVLQAPILSQDSADSWWCLGEGDLVIFKDVVYTPKYMSSPNYTWWV